MWNFQDVFVTRKRSFISAFSIRMTLFKWLFVANFMILHLNQIYFLEQGYVLCKTGILMKPMKNLVIIVGSLWTRYSLKKKIMQTFALIWPPPPSSPWFSFVRILMEPLPLGANLIIECPYSMPFKHYAALCLNLQFYLVMVFIYTVQKMKFSIKDFFSKRIWSLNWRNPGWKTSFFVQCK